MKPFQYNAIVRRVVDGDTIDLDVDLGFKIWQLNMRVRLNGVDSPEKRTRNLLEKQFGYLATEEVERLCPVGSKVLLETVIEKGKFGRILGTILAIDPNVVDPTADPYINVNEYLIQSHYAVRYIGQAKSEVYNAHLANFRWLIENKNIEPVPNDIL